MTIPLKSRIETRILLNFRVHPERIRAVLPPGYEPVLVNGAAVAGVCFIRQERIRPAGVPGFAGVSLAAAAHRVAVTKNGERAVLVLRRDASGLLPKIASRFTGATFTEGSTLEWRGLDAAMSAADGTSASIAASDVPLLSTLFETVDAAADFFRAEHVSYEIGGKRLDVCFPQGWTVAPIEHAAIASSLLAALGAIPDSAYVARDLDAVWR